MCVSDINFASVSVVFFVFHFISIVDIFLVQMETLNVH